MYCIVVAVTKDIILFAQCLTLNPVQTRAFINTHKHIDEPCSASVYNIESYRFYYYRRNILFHNNTIYCFRRVTCARIILYFVCRYIIIWSQTVYVNISCGVWAMWTICALCVRSARSCSGGKKNEKRIRTRVVWNILWNGKKMRFANRRESMFWFGNSPGDTWFRVRTRELHRSEGLLLGARFRRERHILFFSFSDASPSSDDSNNHYPRVY